MGVHMNKLAFGIAASVVALVAATGVQAADPILIDDVAISMATSNWDGPYAGLGGVFETATSAPAETLWGVQGVLGINQTFDGFLLGGEIYLMGTNSSLTGWGVSAGGEVRAGILATDAILIYGALGAEVESGGNTFATIGGGVEFWAMDDMSIDVEYKYYQGLNNGFTGHHVGLSANWHF
jgi:opacity protein-like surface antigen